MEKRYSRVKTTSNTARSIVGDCARSGVVKLAVEIDVGPSGTAVLSGTRKSNPNRTTAAPRAQPPSQLQAFAQPQKQQFRVYVCTH
ncbi:hypothetical protein RB195_017633 [Necator americanus]|uniref:Uncharacterized protein n=1 Tax=Necator americanus TaxID=51031 RepID=A0ABR1C635_NECAM